MAQISYDPITISPNPVSAQRFNLGPYRVTVDIYGDSSTVVLLLHGIPGWRGTWAKVAPLLARNHRVIVPDLLGFGQSDEPSVNFHAQGQAAMLLNLLDTLAVDQIHLVGFDFGGPVAVTLYKLAPQRVLSLTLINTNTFTDTPIPGPLKLAQVPILGDLFFRLAFSKIGLAQMWRAAVADKLAFPHSEYLEALQWPNGIRWTRQIFLTSLRDLSGLYRPIQETLPRIQIPGLVVWGDRDPFFSMAQGERLAAAIPGARLIRLSGCGHFVPEERPAELAKCLNEVLAAA